MNAISIIKKSLSWYLFTIFYLVFYKGFLSAFVKFITKLICKKYKVYF